MLALRKAPARSWPTPTTDRVKTLSLVLSEEFGIPWLLYDGSTGELAGDQDAGHDHTPARNETPAAILAIAAEGRPHVSLVSTGRYRLCLPIHEPDGPETGCGRRASRSRPLSPGHSARAGPPREMAPIGPIPLVFHGRLDQPLPERQTQPGPAQNSPGSVSRAE